MRNMRRSEVGLICLSWIWRGVGGLGGALVFLLQNLSTYTAAPGLHLQHDFETTSPRFETGVLASSLKAYHIRSNIPKYRKANGLKKRHSPLS
jgi:hypothetical protein